MLFKITFLICPDQLQMKTNSVIKTKNDCHADDRKVLGFQASFIFQFANDYKHKFTQTSAATLGVIFKSVTI